MHVQTHQGRRYYNHNAYTAVFALLCSLLWPQALQQVISKVSTISTQLNIFTCVKAGKRLGNIVAVMATAILGYSCLDALKENPSTFLLLNASCW